MEVVEAAGEDAWGAAGGRRFDGILYHGVLMYLDDPAPLVASLCTCTAPGGLASIVALNARTMAVRPALEHRFGDALARFDATGEQGVLGVTTRADIFENLSRLLVVHGVTPEAWYAGHGEGTGPAGMPLFGRPNRSL